jgi:hypothetical protein
MAGDETKAPRTGEGAPGGPGSGEDTARGSTAGGLSPDPILPAEDVSSASGQTADQPAGRRGRKGREPREPVTIDLTAQPLDDAAAIATPAAKAAEVPPPEPEPSAATTGTGDDEPVRNAEPGPASAGAVPPAGRPFGSGRADDAPRDHATPPAGDPQPARSRTGAFVATGIGGAVGGALLALLTITLWPGIIPGHDLMQARLTSAEQAARAAATQDSVRTLQQSVTQSREADGRTLRETQAATAQAQQGVAELRQTLRDPALTERIDRLETALASRDGAPSPAALDMLRRLDTRMSALETRAGAQASASAAARLVVLGRIRDALASGTPFAAETKALASLGLAEQAAAPLARIAGGPPSGGALRAQFLSIRPALLAREGEADLWSWAKGALTRAVSIRRVDDTGATPEAVANRIETAIGSGRMREARTQWDALPQAIRDRTGPPGAAFLQALDARAQAEATVETLTGEALVALGQPQPR